jgi:hypothetical protein
MEQSKGSTIAKNGLLLQKCLEIQEVLSAVKTILCTEKDIIITKDNEYIDYPSGKKTDVKLCPYNINLQIKRVSSFEKDRGHHIDRRNIEDLSKYFENKHKITSLLQKLMISRCITKEEKQELTTLMDNKHYIFQLLFDLILGKQKQFKPTHILFIDASDKKKYEFYICDVYVLIGYILKSSVVSVKETCVHIGKNIYFQRRGGDKSDKNPNQVQTKFKITLEIKQLLKLIHTCNRKFIDDSINNICNNTIT